MKGLTNVLGTLKTYITFSTVLLFHPKIFIKLQSAFS